MIAKVLLCIVDSKKKNKNKIMKKTSFLESFNQEECAINFYNIHLENQMQRQVT